MTYTEAALDLLAGVGHMNGTERAAVLAVAAYRHTTGDPMPVVKLAAVLGVTPATIRRRDTRSAIGTAVDPRLPGPGTRGRCHPGPGAAGPGTGGDSMTATRRALVALVMLVAIGCAPVPDTTPGPDAPTPATTPAPDGTLADPEGSFLTAARAVAPTLAVVPDSDLLDAAYAVCDALDTGLGVGPVAATAQSNGLDDAAAGAIIGGVYFLCPEHAAVVDAWAG